MRLSHLFTTSGGQFQEFHAAETIERNPNDPDIANQFKRGCMVMGRFLPGLVLEKGKQNFILIDNAHETDNSNDTHISHFKPSGRVQTKLYLKFVEKVKIEYRDRMRVDRCITGIREHLRALMTFFKPSNEGSFRIDTVSVVKIDSIHTVEVVTEAKQVD